MLLKKKKKKHNALGECKGALQMWHTSLGVIFSCLFLPFILGLGWLPFVVSP